MRSLHAALEGVLETASNLNPSTHPRGRFDLTKGILLAIVCEKRFGIEGMDLQEKYGGRFLQQYTEEFSSTLLSGLSMSL